LDLLFSHVPNKNQTGNKDSIQVYSLFDRIRVTGLNGVFLITFFATAFSGLESGITNFNGRKTVLFIPFWEANILFYGLEYGERGKTPVLMMPIFLDLVWE